MTGKDLKDELDKMPIDDLKKSVIIFDFNQRRERGSCADFIRVKSGYLEMM